MKKALDMKVDYYYKNSEAIVEIVPSLFFAYFYVGRYCVAVINPATFSDGSSLSHNLSICGPGVLPTTIFVGRSHNCPRSVGARAA